VVRRDLAEILARDLPWDILSGQTVLVTGANGMIPSYLVRTLLALNDARDTGIRVLGMVRNGDKARRVLADITGRPDFVLVEQDVTIPLEVARLNTEHLDPAPYGAAPSQSAPFDSGPSDGGARLDLVIHGASAARPSLHAADPVGTIKANLIGTFNLLETCVRLGCPRFALTSSAEVYGGQATDKALLAEDDYGRVDILSPRSCYSEGKRAAETIAASYHAQYDIDVTVGRFGHIYGPGMELDDGRVQADFAADVVAGRDITLNSDGSASRTYTYVADAVAGFFYALLVGDEIAYNVADPGGLVTIRQLAETFTSARGDRGLKVRFAAGVDAPAYNPTKKQGLDSTRLRGLGWSPAVDLATGLDRTLAWHEERG
jgi:nucleoside-diphosphate-sugar epimerase